MRLIGYCRISKETEGGHSLKAQENAIKNYCLAMQHDLVGMYSDNGVSGAKAFLKRENGITAMRALTDADGIIVAKMDRLSRSQLDWCQTVDILQHNNKALISVSEGFDLSTPMGKAMASLLAVFAQLERDTICERNRISRQNHKRLGLYHGGAVPYGWQVEDGRIVWNAKEQEAIKLARQLHETGMSNQKVGWALYKAGYLSRAGKAMNAGTVRKLLKAK